MIEAIFLATLLYLGQDTDPWSKEDYAREGVYMTLHTMDWGQTRDIARRLDENYWEINPMLGRYPTTNSIDRYFAYTTIMQPAFANALNSEPRKYFQYAGIILEGALVLHNDQIGLTIHF